MGTTGERELLGLLLCGRQREGRGRWLERGELLEDGRGTGWQEEAGEERDRNKERQNQHEGSWASSWGLRCPVTPWAQYPGCRGALLVGWSPVRLGPVGMQLVGAPAG